LIDRLTVDPRVALNVIYLDCAEDELIRRYSQTRRRHPMAPDGTPLIGISREVDLLAPIRARADHLIETTEMSPHDLRAEVAQWFGVSQSEGLAVSLQSFSYKRGLPRGIDMAFDCRFLRNPHWVAELRALDGRDKVVVDHIATDPRFSPFIDKITDLILFLLPAQLDEGKTHLAIGFGCTGGQHRSVAVTELIATKLAEAGWPVAKRHRELERRAAVLPATGAG
jgi:RNase adapter protein RapZ